MMKEQQNGGVSVSARKAQVFPSCGCESKLTAGRKRKMLMSILRLLLQLRTVCRWDWLCKVKLYHPPTALAACVTRTFTCLFRVLATALVASPEKRGRPVPPNAVALSYCFTLANWVGPSFRKLCTTPGHSWLWGAGSSVSYCQRYRASSDQGNCWTLWEQVQVEELLSAVAVTASIWMLGKGFEEWVQNYTRQPFVCHSGRLSIMLRQELA